jgi:histidinol phosphatase-like PHP family hydrolase
MSTATANPQAPPILRHDDHVHAGAFSGHAAPCPLAEMREAGEAAGVRISLREHAPLPLEFLATHPDALNESPQLGRAVGLRVGTGGNIDEFLAAVAAAGLPLGFEIDALPPGWLPESLAMVDLLERRAREHGLEVECFNLSHHYPWDVTFGGLPRALDLAGGAAPFLKTYFGTLRAYASTRQFGAISHLESIRKFDLHLAGGPPFAGHMALYAEQVSETLAVMRRFGVALEYNTNGRNYWGQPFLSGVTLAEAAAMEVSTVVGSDAHRPAAVAQGFTEAAEALAAAGMREVVTFRSRLPLPVPLRRA